MQRFGLRGTPSSVLIGRDGAIVHQAFGVEDAIAVGARIAIALSKPFPETATAAAFGDEDGCGADRCEV